MIQDVFRIIIEMLPEQSVGGGTSVSNIVEKHLQLFVIVKVGSDDCANRWWSSKSSSSNVLHKRIRAYALSNSFHLTGFHASPTFYSFSATLLFSFLTRNLESLPCRKSLCGPFQLPYTMSVFPSPLKSASATPLPCWYRSSTPLDTMLKALVLEKQYTAFGYEFFLKPLCRI